MMNSRSGETICAFLNPCRRGMECGLACRDGDKRGREGRGRDGREEERERKKAEKKNKFTRFIHRPLAWYRCLTMVTKEIKNMGISMWKAPGPWLCVQKAKELWFWGIFNPHSDSNKGLAVALRAVVQSDWGSGGWKGGRGGDRQDHRPYLFPLFTLACLYSHWRAAFPLCNPLPSSSSSSYSTSLSLKVVNKYDLRNKLDGKKAMRQHRDE